MSQGARGKRRRRRRLRVAVVVGTRPEAIKMAPVILALRKDRSRFATRVILSAQHREMSDQVFASFGIKPDRDLDVMRRKQTLFDVTGRLVARFEGVLRDERPDIVLVQGDTTTTFVAALAAFYLGIRVAHVEAGLRTSDKANPFPEEINRRLTTDLADLHFAPTETARRALRAEGVPARSIHVTGNTVIDALLWTVRSLRGRRMPELPRIDAHRRVLVVTSHRRENWGAPLREACSAIRDVAQAFASQLDVVFPVHPNPLVVSTVRSVLGREPNVHLIPPLSYHPFVALMSRADLILTDSGGVQEEAPSLGKPVLVMRKTTERPEAVRAGTVKLVGTDRKRIVREVSRLLADRAAYDVMARRKNPYGDGKAAPRIVRVLAGLDR